MATYEVQRILFFARGPAGSTNQACFAFTWSHGECQETATHQCHVFRCNIPEAVNQVSGRSLVCLLACFCFCYLLLIQLKLVW